MASRRETSDRRAALLEELRRACHDGSLPPGEPLPPVRDFVGRYNVSHRVVGEVVQTLTDEGLLYSVPRKGTFAGRPQQAREGLYLLVTETPVQGNDQLSRLQFGFEEQISGLGGTCLTLSHTELKAIPDASQTFAPSGIFCFETHRQKGPSRYLGASCPQVFFSERNVAVPTASALDAADARDTIFFDNESAGHQVTHYLLQRDHRRIAFLGLHGVRQETGPFVWSRERAAGWQRALNEAGIAADELLILPETLPAEASTIRTQQDVAYRQAGRLIRSIRDGEASAIVTVNVHAARGLMEALRESDLRPEQWPVLTTFGVGDTNVSMMTSMLLPWEQMGRKAADLLWSRSQRAYEGEERRVAVPMRLIARLTCSPAWKIRPEAALWSTREAGLAVTA